MCVGVVVVCWECVGECGYFRECWRGKCEVEVCWKLLFWKYRYRNEISWVFERRGNFFVFVFELYEGFVFSCERDCF